MPIRNTTRQSASYSNSAVGRQKSSAKYGRKKEVISVSKLLDIILSKEDSRKWKSSRENYKNLNMSSTFGSYYHGIWNRAICGDEISELTRKRINFSASMRNNAKNLDESTKEDLFEDAKSVASVTFERLNKKYFFPKEYSEYKFKIPFPTASKSITGTIDCMAIERDDPTNTIIMDHASNLSPQYRGVSKRKAYQALIYCYLMQHYRPWITRTEAPQTAAVCTVSWDPRSKQFSRDPFGFDNISVNTHKIDSKSTEGKRRFAEVDFRLRTLGYRPPSSIGLEEAV